MEGDEAVSAPSAPSIVRTLVPVIVGQIAAYFATLGVVLPEDVMAAVTVVLGFVFTSVWYLAVRWLEQKFPKLGALLGWAAVPAAYVPAKDRKAVEAQESEVASSLSEPGDVEGPRH